MLCIALVACKKENPDTNPGPEVEKEKIVRIKVKYGDIYIWLHKETPLHRDNFLKLTSEGFFDSTTFHRAVPDFVIQGGDPNSRDENTADDGQGGPGYQIDAEIDSRFPHVYGAVGAARQADNVNPQRKSSGSQFYIVVNKNGTPNLNGAYTVFGKVIKGMEVAELISKLPRNRFDVPDEFIRMDAEILEKTLDELNTEFGFVP